MSSKMKAFGVLLMALTISTAIAISATAEVGGHFSFEIENNTLVGEDVVKTRFTNPASGSEVVCEQATYFGVVNSATKTATEFSLAPTYKKCVELPGEIEATVKPNGCEYVFTIRKVEPEFKDNTVHLKCPMGKVMVTEINGPFGICTVTIKSQTPTEGGVAYVTGGSKNNTHDLKIEVTLGKIHAEYDGGFFKCGFTPNPKTVDDEKLSAQTTLKAFNAGGQQVAITATGG